MIEKTFFFFLNADEAKMPPHLRLVEKNVLSFEKYSL